MPPGLDPARRRLALELLQLARPRWPALPGWPALLRRPPAPRPYRPGDDERLPAALLRALRAALRAQGQADCSLSGGLDSATLAALLAAGGPARAFTLVDDYDRPGEWRRAARLARRYGLEHVCVRVAQEQLPDRFADAVRACDAPIWNGKGVAALLFFEGARAAGASTLVSGCGADELLCGHPAALRAWPGRLRRARALAGSLLEPALRRALPRAPAAVRPPGLPELAFRQWLWLQRVLPAATLPIELRLGTAAGLSLGLPYLDPAFARLALALPMRLRVRAGHGKWALRVATAGLVPDELRFAPKLPRLAPAGGGTRRARARWSALLHELLAPERIAALGILRERRVARLLRAHTTAAQVDPAADALLLSLAALTLLNARSTQNLLKT